MGFAVAVAPQVLAMPRVAVGVVLAAPCRAAGKRGRVKALVERLELLRLAILDEATGIADAEARQDALDLVIEASAIASAIPDIKIVIPSRTARHRPPAPRPAWDHVTNGGKHQ
jgi:hypothetical protein